jgi:predicted RNA-binding Zn-ribbon protein involved in translation (DUF1610 family)
MFAKGQTIFIEAIGNHYLARTGTITKGVVKTAGAKYITVEYGWKNLRFDKLTLLEAAEFGSARYRLFPSEQAVYDDRERAEIHSHVRAVLGGHRCDLSLNQMRKIKTAIDEGADAPNKEFPAVALKSNSGAYFICPTCNKLVLRFEQSHGNVEIKHCKWCGQRIDWRIGDE